MQHLAIVACAESCAEGQGLICLLRDDAAKGCLFCHAALLQKRLCFGAFMWSLNPRSGILLQHTRMRSLGSNSSLIVCWKELNFVTSASTHAWPGQEAIDAAGEAAQQQENRSCIAIIMKYRYISPYIYRFVVTCLNKDLRR